MRIVVDGLAYPIVVSLDASEEIATLVEQARGPTVVVADRHVEPLASSALHSLRARGCEVRGCLTIEAGERRKQWRSVAALHEEFLTSHVDRECIVVAIGGGTLTDVAGFAAATFMRGIRWLPVATTLLGMVDAGIGGKTGVDLPQGKNLIGAFWPPVGVVANLQALDTLDESHIRGGVSEIVKTAIIGNWALLDDLDRCELDSPPSVWANVVAGAAGVKARVVSADPSDSNGRAALNLGHTFAHALEAASRYRLAHGAAVALGLRAAGIVGRDVTGWAREDHQRMLGSLRRFGIKLRYAKSSPDSIVEAMRADKKRLDGAPRFVVPVRPGEVRANVQLEETVVRDALAELASAPRRGGF